LPFEKIGCIRLVGAPCVGGGDLAKAASVLVDSIIISRSLRFNPSFIIFNVNRILLEL
jgi:hypothetical protein